MSDNDIKALKAAVKEHATVIWLSPSGPDARLVESVEPPPKCIEEPEPSDCAFFRGGHYVALYNCSLKDFVIAVPITLKP